MKGRRRPELPVGWPSPHPLFLPVQHLIGMPDSPKSRKARNPFYGLVLIVGIAFLLTACAYTMLAFLDVQGRTSSISSSRLLVYLNEHGVKLMGIELAVLCVAMVAAFGTEDFWQRRFDRRHGRAAPAGDDRKRKEPSRAADADSHDSNSHQAADAAEPDQAVAPSGK